MGKVGATVGTLAFKPMQEAMGIRGPFLVGSAISLVASVVAFFFLPEVGPDFLVQQDIDFKNYLAEQGYDITRLGLDDKKNYSSTNNNDSNNSAGSSNDKES